MTRYKHWTKAACIVHAQLHRYGGGLRILPTKNLQFSTAPGSRDVFPAIAYLDLLQLEHH